MAGEIHNFKKRRPNRQDDRSTDKYYESGDVSAVQGWHTAADSTLKPGRTPTGIPTKLPKQDDRRADKYYANQIPPAPTLQQLQKGLKGDVPRLGERRQFSFRQQKEIARRQTDLNADMTINEPHEINGVMQEVASRLQEGQTGVVVYVQKGNSNLLRRARAALEMLVTREVITEEQYHDVKLSYTLGESEQKALDAKLGAPPAPKGEKVLSPTNADDSELDPEAFLSGQANFDDEDKIPDDGLPVVEVDTSNDVPDSPAPEYPSAPVQEEEDEDNDFVVPASPLPSAQFPVSRTTDESAAISILSERQAVETYAEGVHNTGHTGEVSVSENQPTPENTSLGGDIVAEQAMDGIGEVPKPARKPGRRSGRGAI